MTSLYAVGLILVFIFITVKYLKRGSDNNSAENQLKKLIDGINQIKSEEDLYKKLDDIYIDSNLSVLILKSIHMVKNNDFKEILVTKALSKKSELVLNYIKLNYENCDNKTKYMYLEYLSVYGSVDAMKLFIDFMKKDYNNFAVLPVKKLSENPRYADILFPEIIEIPLSEDKRYQVYNLTNSYLENKLLFSDKVESIKENILSEYKSMAYDYERYNDKETSFWRYDLPNYMKTRDKMLTLITLFGFIYDEVILEELKRAMHFNDPMINAYSLVALLRLGESVDNYVITLERLCENPQVRKYIYFEFERLNLKMKFPYKFKTQMYIAQSEIFELFKNDAIIYAEPLKIKFYNEIEISNKYSIYVFICDVRYSKEDKLKSVLAYSGPFLNELIEAEGRGLSFIRYEDFGVDELSKEFTYEIIKEKVNDWILKL